MKVWQKKIALVFVAMAVAAGCSPKMKRVKVTPKDEHYMEYYTSNPSSKK